MTKKEFIELEHNLFNDEIMSTESEIKNIGRFIEKVMSMSKLLDIRNQNEKFTLELELINLNLKVVIYDHNTHFNRESIRYLLYIGIEQADSGEYDYAEANVGCFYPENLVESSFSLLTEILHNIKLASLLKSGGHKMTVEQFHQLQVGIEKSDLQDFYENVPDDCIITCESDTLP